MGNIVDLYEGNQLYMGNQALTVDDMLLLLQEPAIKAFGIPLTPERLERLGFVYNGIYWVRGRLSLELEEAKLHAVDNTGYGIIIAYCVDTVHELQNIIHALTGTELEYKQ